MATISLVQAIRNALEAEDAAARFYDLLAHSTDDRQARNFLLAMAEDEKRHHQQISRLALKAADQPLPDIPDDNCELVETAPEWAELDQLDYDSALAVALEAEEHAELFYDALAGALQGREGDEGKKFFQDLAATERQHATRLRQLMK